MTIKMTFKKLKDTEPQDSLKFLLHKHLSGLEDERPLTNIHASALTKPEGFCPRFYALHDVLQVPPKKAWVSAADNVTWRMGNDLQDQIVHAFGDMGKAIAHWKCVSCGEVHHMQKRPGACEKCSCTAFKPLELRFVSKDCGASCGVDLLALLTKEELTVTELKTMKKEEFEKLEAPLAEHRLRTNLYLRIVADSTMLQVIEKTMGIKVNTKRAKILYVCKGGYKADPDLKKWGMIDHFSPFKEYVIERDDKQTHELWKRSKVVKSFREGDIAMPCGICTTALVLRAAKCSKRKECFSGDYPAKHVW